MDITPAPRDLVLLSQWLLDNHGDVYRDYHASRPAARAALEFIRTDAAPVSPVGADTPGDATVRPTEYTVSLFPEDSEEAHVFDITVSYRGRGLWAVKRHSMCLASDGTWSYEPSPSNREDDWLATHRFDLETAKRLAVEAAPNVRVNGYRAADAAVSASGEVPQ